MANIKMLVQGLLIAVIGLVIVLEMIGETIDDVQDAGDTVNETGAPLSGLYASDSVVPLIYMGVGLLAVLGLAFSIGKSA